MVEREATTSKRHALARDLLVPLMVGVVGMVGSLAGVMIANSSNAHQAERQKLVEFEGKVLEQRLLLIDRAAKIFGKSPGFQDLWRQYVKQVVSVPKGGTPKLPLDLVDKLTEAQGEFQSVLFLSQVYFGPKTRAAIKDLSSSEGPWWQKPKAKQDALIAEMIAEASLGITAIPALTQSPP